MPAIADLIGQDAADKLAQLRMRLGQHQDPAARRAALRVASAPPPRPQLATCPECGQPRPAPAAIFSSEAGQ